MIFKEWMDLRGLSPSSAKKYEGAINGVLTEWSIENGLLDGPLSSVTSISQFQDIAAKIIELPIFQERNKRGNHMYSNALARYAEYLSEGFENDIESDIDSIIKDSSLNETEKSRLVKSRIGQGTFRQKLIGYWKGCSVTGVNDSSLLIASHIKPWSASDNVERLDMFNGLLLIPNLDVAFDAGLITFKETGGIDISCQLKEPEKLGISEKMSVKLLPQHEAYMQFHRKNVYRSN